MLWEQAHPGEDLPPKLSMKYGIGDLADDQGNLRKAIAKMLPAAKDRVHATYKPDELRDWKNGMDAEDEEDKEQRLTCTYVSPENT